MRPSTKEKSKNFEAISVAFNRSLDYLEIQPARYKRLPLRQRRLALCEAIFSTARRVVEPLNWYLDRSDLHSKRLWDYSPDQIRRHQTVLDSLIALVCLGETSFVRPLVTYLSFPEQRWSITIDSVLRAISEEPMKGPLFRLPSESDKAMWRKWAVDRSEPLGLNDFSTSLCAQIGVDDITWHSPSAYGFTASSLINWDQFLDVSWKYFDEKQAKFCKKLYVPLREQKFKEVAESIDAFVSDYPREGNYNTIVSCLNDLIDESDLPRPAIKQHWILLAGNRKISPKAVAVLFQVLDYSKRDRSLAREFGEKMLGSDLNFHLLRCVTDLLVQNTSAPSIYRMVKTYSDLDDCRDQTRVLLLDLAPMFRTTVIVWLSNIFSTELEDICILGSEAPSKRKPLLDSIDKALRANNRAIMRLSVFEHSANTDCKTLGQYMRKYFEFREPFVHELGRHEKTSRLVSKYVDMFRSTFRKLVCLVSPRTRAEVPDAGES